VGNEQIFKFVSLRKNHWELLSRPKSVSKSSYAYPVVYIASSCYNAWVETVTKFLVLARSD